MRPLAAALLLGLIGLFPPPQAAAQDTTQAWRFPSTLAYTLPATLDTTAARIFIQPTALPEEVLQTVEDLAFVEAPLQEAFFTLAQTYRLNLLVDERIDGRVTVAFDALPVLNALILLCRQNGLTLEQDGTLFRIRLPDRVLPSPEPSGEAEGPPKEAFAEEPPASALRVTVRNGLLSADLAGEPVQAVAQAVAGQSDLSLFVRPGVTGYLSGFVADVPVAEGVRLLMENNGFVVRHEEGHLVIDLPEGSHPEAPPASETLPAGVPVAGISVKDGLVSANVADVGVLSVLQALADQSSLNVVTHSPVEGYGAPEGRVTAKWVDLPLDRALDALLRGTSYTYRLDGNVLIVADRQASGMATSRLLRLRHLPAGGVLERLPESLRQNASFQLIEEQNGLIVTGPGNVIDQAEQFIREIDAPTPQILIEVLVVEFETTRLKELGVTFLGGLLPPEVNLPVVEGGWKTYLFGGGSDQGGPLDILGDASTANRFINFWTELLGISSIGELPSDFYFRLQALDRDGKANVRSRPHIATLNGQPASITVGTSQYYILKSVLPYQAPGLTGGESERFERVEANVKLEIVPWVTASGGITAEIRPSFSTPVGILDPRIPPTLNNWYVDTVVRLNEGETIIIGGLIQEKESVTSNRVPFLGSLPLLGRLFRNSRRDVRKSELVIFLTPHVFFGDEQDAQKWFHLKERLRLQGRGEG